MLNTLRADQVRPDHLVLNTWDVPEGVEPGFVHIESARTEPVQELTTLTFAEGSITVQADEYMKVLP